MNINRNNYAAFFLDYREGNLTQEERKAVLAFVKSNPDLGEELDSFEIITVDALANAFPDKDMLKKNKITGYNYKTWLVAFLENDLNEEDRMEVEHFMEQNPRNRSAFEIIRQTKLLPDYCIRFENKSSLKKRGAIIPMWSRIAAAACLVLGLVVYWFMNREPARQFTDVNLPQLKEDSSEKMSAPDEKNVALNQPGQPVKVVAGDSEKNLSSNKAKQHVAGRINEEQLPGKNEIQFPLPEATPVEEPALAENSKSGKDPVMVINQVSGEDTMKAGGREFAALDENDLAELGLIDRNENKNPAFRSAVNGVRNLFGVNVRYETKSNLLEPGYRETLALGPVEISRNVLR